MPGDFLEDDLSIFTNTDEFGHTATWTPAGGSPTSVDGQYYDLNLVIDPYTGEVDTVNDALFVCAKSDVSTAAQEDALTVAGVDYKIKSVPSSSSNQMLRIFLRYV